jgi:hypothetical protein
MRLTQAFLWQPGWLYRAGILLGGTLLVAIIGYLHVLSGLAYEFHAFFIVPVLAVSWFDRWPWRGSIDCGPGFRPGNNSKPAAGWVGSPPG